MTQSTLAEQIGLTFQQIQKYERGINRVSASMLYRIARSLAVEPGFVFEGLPAASRGRVAAEPLDTFALSPGAPALADIFPRLSHSRQGTLLAVARAMLGEQPLALTGRSGADGTLAGEVRTPECRQPPARTAPLLHLRHVR